MLRSCSISRGAFAPFPKIRGPKIRRIRTEHITAGRIDPPAGLSVLQYNTCTPNVIAGGIVDFEFAHGIRSTEIADTGGQVVDDRPYGTQGFFGDVFQPPPNQHVAA
jgi:hypothetical protein